MSSDMEQKMQERYDATLGSNEPSVTHQDVIEFMKSAFRNIEIDALDEHDITDIQCELIAFKSRTIAAMNTDKLDKAAQTITDQAALIGELVGALKPFADCTEYIKKKESDDEWAKFRLIVKNYRDAQKALAKVEQQGNI